MLKTQDKYENNNAHNGNIPLKTYTKNILTSCFYKTIHAAWFTLFIYDQVIKTLLSHSASPVYFAGLVPAAILSVRSIVSVLALEVKKRKEEEQNMKGSGVSNWISGIFVVFTCNYHMPTGAYILCVKDSALTKDYISLS